MSLTTLALLLFIFIVLLIYALCYPILHGNDGKARQPKPEPKAKRDPHQLYVEDFQETNGRTARHVRRHRDNAKS